MSPGVRSRPQAHPNQRPVADSPRPFYFKVRDPKDADIGLERYRRRSPALFPWLRGIKYERVFLVRRTGSRSPFAHH